MSLRCNVATIMLFDHIIGSMTGRNGRGIYVYFVANFSEAPISFGTWNDDYVALRSVTTAGKHCGAFAGKINKFLWLPLCL